MGQLKFNLANADGIYLHDTPKKELFAQDQRNLSNGCVRLEDAPRFARWLLGNELPGCGRARAARTGPDGRRAGDDRLPRLAGADAACRAAVRNSLRLLR